MKQINAILGSKGLGSAACNHDDTAGVYGQLGEARSLPLLLRVLLLLPKTRVVAVINLNSN